MTAYRVRCPRCGGAAPDDERWCSGCGAALADQVLALEPVAAKPADTVGPVASHRRPAHRRRWRDPRLAGAAVAVLVAVVVGVLANGRGDDAVAPPSTTASTSTSSAPGTTTTAIPPLFLTEQTGGVRLVLARSGQISLVDLDANTVVQREVEEFQATSGRVPPGQRTTMARRGERLVFQAGGAVFALPLDLSGDPVRVGVSVLFVPSVRDDRLWLVTMGGDGPMVQEVDSGGRVWTSPIALPADWYPQAAIASGLVLTRFDRFQVWDPATGRVRFESQPGANLVAAGGDVVAWKMGCPPPLCRLHLSDVGASRDRVVPFDGDVSSGAFSPDATLLAMWAYNQSDTEYRPELTVVDVESGEATGFAVGPQDEGALSWSASGRWLFSLPFERGSVNRPMAYRVDGRVGLPVALPAAAGGVVMVAL